MLLFISCKEEQEDRPEKFIRVRMIASAIDSLKTNDQVEQFVEKTDTLFKQFTLKEVQDIECLACDSSLVNLANRLKINYAYYKADFDNNGYTDLMVTGANKTYTNENTDPDLLVEYSKDFNALVLMNFGKGMYKTYDLTDGRFLTIIPKVELSGSKYLLAVYRPQYHHLSRKYRDESKFKLTFKFNDFIEYNTNPSEYQIEKIEYATKGCFGECPIFELVINKNGEATLVAKNYNYTEAWQKGTLLSGVYKTKIQDKQLNELTGLLNYIDFAHLKNDYQVSWTDDETALLKITYNNGKVKIITDYGLQGTYGLKMLHKKLFELRTNQKWSR